MIEGSKTAVGKGGEVITGCSHHCAIQLCLSVEIIVQGTCLKQPASPGPNNIKELHCMSAMHSATSLSSAASQKDHR